MSVHLKVVLCTLRMGGKTSMVLRHAGETNLKVRRPLNIKGTIPDSPEAAAGMSVTLACEPPNNNLHYFIGRAVVQVCFPSRMNCQL